MRPDNPMQVLALVFTAVPRANSTPALQSWFHFYTKRAKLNYMGPETRNELGFALDKEA